jgi:CHAT domain-containing protein/tetratricopeptide (TPR) repeat protein
MVNSICDEEGRPGHNSGCGRRKTRLWNGRLGLVLSGCLLTWLLGVPPFLLSGGGAEPATKLTQGEQAQLKFRAALLILQATRFYQRGQYKEAANRSQEVQAIMERLYPPAQSPKGDPLLASSLHLHAQTLLATGEYTRALELSQRALTMRERIYPTTEYPKGHTHLAESMDQVGSVLRAQGEYARALDHHQRALAMFERLFPRGHFFLARSLNNLGDLFQALGEYARALGYHQRALAMKERLYPRTAFPQGHPDLALSLSNLGNLLWVQGEYASALDHCQRALAMREQVYPKARFPQGHLDLALSLNNLGLMLADQGKYARALDCCQKALAMKELFYSRAEYPRGHPDLALSLNNLGFIRMRQGAYASAVDYWQKALAMSEWLYPRTEYPQGHPDLARSLNNLGALWQAQGNYARALDYQNRALAMQQGFAELFLAAASEAEAFSHAASLPLYRDGVLSVSRHLPSTEESAYAQVWRTKAAITSILARRHQALLGALDAAAKLLTPQQQNEARQVWHKLLTTRRALSRLLLFPALDPEGHRKRLQRLSQEKADLEQKLAKLVAAFGSEQALKRGDHTVLIRKLPLGTVFIDFLRYVRFDYDPKRSGHAAEQRTACYAAFVLRRGRPVRRVELGPAADIDQALAAWRADIQDEKTSPAAQKLRRLVWEPLSRHVPADTRTLFVAPDNALARLPWAALPVTREGRVLVEVHAVAVVLHGPFLLEQLGLPAPSRPDKSGLLVAVGAVNYDAQPQVEQGMQVVARNRAAEWGDRKVVWKALPGTRRELATVVERAGKRSVHQWAGSAASTNRLLAELPKARWVHLATHGFFADARFRSVLQIDEKLFDRRAFWEGPPPGARNPLVLSGLVLAGANRPLPADLQERTQSDGGILTAEAIASLPLHRLELAVLSACETGLGKVDVAGGEGVFGLQRAFHLAGARTVVASLWKVNDEATTALMALFYDHLWRRQQPPLEALRAAQLTLYHHPERIPALARERGPNFDKVVRLPVQPASARKPSQAGKSATKLWAGFVLSGIGR